MTIANTCVLIAAVLPILTVGLAKFTSIKSPKQGGYDNNSPRDWIAKQTGWKARSNAAQQNGFEILPIFMFAVLAAQLAGLDQARTDQLAMIFIGLRLVYNALYLANIGALRTLVWFAGFATAVAIFAPTLKFALN
jgi:uncharacterized MAPEG superfamily protein